MDKEAAALRQIRQHKSVTQHMYASWPWHADQEEAEAQVRDACAPMNPHILSWYHWLPIPDEAVAEGGIAIEQEVIAVPAD